MTSRAPTLPTLAILPVLAGVAAAAAVPGFPTAALVLAVAAAALRVVLTWTRRELVAPRVWTTLWISGPAAAMGYVMWAARGDGETAPALLAAGVAGTAAGLVAPATAAGALRLLALSAALAAGAAIAAPNAAVTAAVLAYAATVVPAVLALDARYGGPRWSGGDLNVRRLQVPHAGRRAWRGTARASLALLSLGLPLGLWLFATLPTRGRPLPDRRGDAPTPGARGALGERGAGDGFDDPARVPETGGRLGRRSPFRASLRPNPRVVWSVRVDGGVEGPAPLWLRGATFDAFTGSAWERSRAAEASTALGRDGWLLLRPPAVSGTRWRLRIVDHVGGADGPLPLVPETDRLRLLGWDDGPALRQSRDGVVTVPGRWAPESMFEEEAIVARADRASLRGRASTAAVSPLEGYVRAPPEADAYRRIAGGVVGAATDAAERAERLEAWLRGPDFRYALTDLPMDPRRPVADFLLRVRRGHCWCFASAMTAMMRSLGHPARLATGWRGGDWLKTLGEWSFRGTHAHAWCEVFFEGVGWVTYDPTPPAASDSRTGEGLSSEGEPTVLERLARFGPDDRRRVFEDAVDALARMGRAGLDATRTWARELAGAAALLLTWGLVRRRRRSAGLGAGGPGGEDPRAHGPYARALATLARHGMPRRQAETPDELAVRAGRARPGASVPLGLLTTAHVRARYGGVEPGREALAGLEAAADDLEARLRGEAPEDGR